VAELAACWRWRHRRFAEPGRNSLTPQSQYEMKPRIIETILTYMRSSGGAAAGFTEIKRRLSGAPFYCGPRTVQDFLTAAKTNKQ